MITYKAIIQYFDSIADQHQQINSFTYGELNFFDKDKFTEYPALHITPTATSIDDQVVVYGFDVIIFDRYNIESNKMRNEANCLSDSLLILQDLCKEITDGKYFINADTLISMELPVSAQPFIDTEPDSCSGWATSFNVITPNEASACLIPYFNPERQNALEFTLPNSAPSNLAWYSRERIHNQTSFTGQEVSTLSAVVDTTPGSDILTMQGSSSTWSPNKNAFHFYDASTTNQMNLQHPITTITYATFFVRIKDFSRYSPTTDNNSICYIGSPNNDGFEVIIQGGFLKIISWTDFSQIVSDFTICPMNGNSFETAHRRLEPFTFCIQFDSVANEITLWWGGTRNEKASMTTVFNFSNKFFGIGNPNIETTSDFYLQEYIYSPTDMTDVDIESTMEWLNYR